MSDSVGSKSSTGWQNRLASLGMGLAITLCLLACVLFLLVPTTSISVDSVYQGF